MQLFSSTLALHVVVGLLVSASAASLSPDAQASEEAALVDSLTAVERPSDASSGESAGHLRLEARADPALGDAGGGGGNGTSAPTAATATMATAAPFPGTPPKRHPGNDDVVFYIIIGTTTGLGLIFIVICAVCWLKYNSVGKQVDDEEFVKGEFSQSASGYPGDGKLALSAQMYHYQHQKQQMMALEKSNGESKHGASDADSDADNEEDADLTTVYECPGLAPTGEMEVRNPFFKEEFDHAPDSARPATK